MKRGKDQSLQSQNVVHKISCCDCDISYVGQTETIKNESEHISDILIGGTNLYQ